MKTIVILVVVIGLAATVGPIVIGYRAFDGQVVQSPYERGLNWDEERRARQDCSLQPSLLSQSFQEGSNSVRFGLEGPSSALVAARPRLFVTRPHTSAEDATYELTMASRGSELEAEIALPQPGTWDLIVEIDCGESRASFSWRIEAAGVAATAGSSADPGE